MNFKTGRNTERSRDICLRRSIDIHWGDVCHESKTVLFYSSEHKSAIWISISPKHDKYLSKVPHKILAKAVQQCIIPKTRNVLEAVFFYSFCLFPSKGAMLLRTCAQAKSIIRTEAYGAIWSLLSFSFCLTWSMNTVALTNTVVRLRRVYAR